MPRCAIRDELSRVAGVGDVTVSGAGAYAHANLARSGEAARPQSDGQRRGNTLREQNVQVAAGRVGQPPAPREPTIAIHRDDPRAG